MHIAKYSLAIYIIAIEVTMSSYIMYRYIGLFSGHVFWGYVYSHYMQLGTVQRELCLSCMCSYYIHACYTSTV